MSRDDSRILSALSALRPKNGTTKLVWWGMGILATIFSAILLGAWTRSGADHDAIIRIQSDYAHHEEWVAQEYPKVMADITAIKGEVSKLREEVASMRGAMAIIITKESENSEILKKLERRSR